MQQQEETLLTRNDGEFLKAVVVLQDVQNQEASELSEITKTSNPIVLQIFQSKSLRSNNAPLINLSR